jgi:diguanylate cyclase (GGDEF)-like protein
MTESPGSWSTQQLAEFAAAIADRRDEASALRVAADRAAEALDAEYAAVVRGGRIGATTGFPAGRVPAEGLLRADGPRPGELAELEGPGELAVAGAPIEAEPGGRLLLFRDPDDPFSADELTLVRGMARVLALALRQIETMAGLQERQALLERLSRIQQSIRHRVELGTVLDAIVEGARDLLGEPYVALRLVDPGDPQRMRIVSSVGFDDELMETLREGRVGEGAGGRAIAEGRLVVVEDYEHSGAGLAAMPPGTVQAAMAAPVREGSSVAGSLVIASYEPGRRWSPSEREVLMAFAEHASLALMDARTVATAVHQAVHDPLTGLPNRTLFHDRLEHALEIAARRGTRVAVLFLDLDHFKQVNDTHGHAAGDALLVGLARRISGALRGSDTVARFGGDEFAVLLEEVGDEADAMRVAEAVAAGFVRPIEAEGQEHFVTASIGVAVSAPGDVPQTLLRDADAAMYRAKERGRAGAELFDDGLRARVSRRLQVERELRDALARDELRLALQPLVELPSRRICGAEALLRWEHPARGVVAAGDFIRVAEDSGLIVPLGGWVIDAACREAARWRAAGGDLRVAVNLSVRQLAQPGLAAIVADALLRHGLPAWALEFEITESVLIDGAELPRATLMELRDLGVRLMLDDFGTGFASLAYLRRLPLDGLKVDRSFVEGLGRDAEATAIVEAVAGIARGMGLELVGEGVEDPGQLRELERLAAHRAQGFLLGRPMEPDAFLALAGGGAPANAAA